MMIADVAIIGGGLSGLAAAVELARGGAHVALFEQHGKLGGRCRSYIDSVTGDTVDNGQHVLIGAYTSTFRYLDLIGSRDDLKPNRLTSLWFHHPDKGFVEFDLQRTMPPLVLPKGFVSSPLLKNADRVKMASMALEFLRWNEAIEAKLRTQSVEEWLMGHGQSVFARKNFWFPLAVAIMNEAPVCASAFLFASALKTAFFGARKDPQIVIPAVGQSDVYVNPALRFLEDRHAQIFAQTEASSISLSNNGGAVDGIILRNGVKFSAKHVICTVPHYAVEKLLPGDLYDTAPFWPLQNMPSSPIISVNLWFEKSFMEHIMLGVLGKTTQWLFNRSRILRERSKSAGHCGCTISAGYNVVALPKEEIVAKILADIHAIYPPEKTGRLLHSIVIKEKRATLSATNENENFRPETITPLDNFFLAGDWTATGLPPTIEGAVRSGFAAAEICRSGC